MGFGRNLGKGRQPSPHCSLTQCLKHTGSARGQDELAGLHTLTKDGKFLNHRLFKNSGTPHLCDLV